MKKFLPFIIVLVILVQIFAPFSVTIGVGDNKKDVGVVNNKAEAATGEGGIILFSTPSATATTITLAISVIWTVSPNFLDSRAGVRVTWTDSVTGAQTQTTSFDGSWKKNGKNAAGSDIWTNSITFKNLTPATMYSFTVEARQVKNVNLSLKGFSWDLLAVWNPENDNPTVPDMVYNVTLNDTATTNAAGVQTVTTGATKKAMNEEAVLPGCVLLTASTWVGCFGRIVYYMVFKPTAFVFAKTGLLLDFAVGYSVRDSSYRSVFVAEGWKIVRDLCNMLFIFVLMYIAVGTILDLHGFSTKKMLVNVIIVGLLINFSLFAVQVVIDASNILTRIFYNSQTIVIGPTVNGVVQGQTDENGDLKLSEAIVAKINPQNLIFQADQVTDIGNSSSSTQQISSSGVSAWTFLLVTILASIVNIVGLLTFLSCSLIFVSRVVGLWLAMIFAPLAFFSLTVPALEGIPMVGWNKWLPDTMRMAFLAPIFVFFMYLIVKFLETGLGLTQAINATKMDFVLGIFVPFIFIMVLLTKAKSIAHDFSGEIGQSITKGIAAFGAVALGTAALGLAAAGRGTIGAVSKHVQNDNARNKDKDWKGNIKNNFSGLGANPFKYIGAVGKSIKDTGKAASAWTAEGIHNTSFGAGKDASGNKQSWGQKLQKDEKEFNKKGQATHELDGKTSDMANKLNVGKDTKYSQLTEPQQIEVRKAVDKDAIAKSHYKSNDWASIKDRTEKDTLDKNVNQAYDNYNDNIKNKKMSTADAEVLLKQDLNYSGLNEKDPSDPTGKTFLKKKDSSADMVGYSTANVGLGEFSAALRRGTYDLRNLSALQTKSKGLSKTGVGIITAIAAGTRMGMKQSGIDYGTGTGKGNSFKDIGTLITSALKDINVKIETPKSSGGGHSSGGGGGHH